MEQKQSKSGLNTILNKYLSEFVYGGIDGCVTTFAVVAGAVGANLETSIIIILGFANLLADGLSMSIGAFLSSKSSRDNYLKFRKREFWEIKHERESEIEEIREIYREKGFEGELLEQVVQKITENEERWVNVMMKDELGMIPEQKSPFGVGLATYSAFIFIGLIPLGTYLFNWFYPIKYNPFIITSVLTGLGFAVVGFLKAKINHTSIVKGVFETLLLGTLAAIVAYFVGDFLEYLLSKT